MDEIVKSVCTSSRQTVVYLLKVFSLFLEWSSGCGDGEWIFSHKRRFRFDLTGQLLQLNNLREC